MNKPSQNALQQSKLILEELEERRLFSGGIEGLIVSDLDSEANAIYRDLDAQTSLTEKTNGGTAAAEQQTREVAFVDAGVDNYQQLVDDLLANTDSSRNIEVVVLDQDKDGIEEISRYLADRDDLDAIHIIAHGDDASLQLGNTELNADSLEQNNLKIALWANSFAETGDILIYGCNLAETEAGQSLINDISSLTLADVAASTDLTGDASQGGDWALEFSVGQIESSVAVSVELQQEYQGTFATYTVTSLADSGAGSLREAVTLANAAGGADTIEFSVAGIINLSSALPSIGEELAIDGSTAPGYSGDPVVNLDGSGVTGNGLRFTSGADNSSVNALMITNFTGNGIQIDSGADGISITGNWIGTTGTGTTGDGNSNNGINVQGANTVIGGVGVNDGNVITNNGNEGINLTGTGATGTLIQGNIIGLDPDGSTGSGNGDVGIALLTGSHNTTIGGTDPNAGNIISMNFEGIEINSNNNTVQGNYIGTDITGTLPRGNDSDDGIEIQNNATGNLIGGTEEGAGNLIAYNLLDGVNLVSGSGNTVLGNDIHSNGDQDIDLGAGVNNDQAAPVLASAQTSGSELTIAGSLSSTANSYFRIEFFGADQTYLGFVNVATDGLGNATFNTTLTASVASGTLITSTATKSDVAYSTYSDTSAYSSIVTAGNAGTAIWRDASTTPQTSDWDGSAFGPTTASAPSGDYRIMQGAEAPTRDEIIIIGVDESSNINGEIWDGSSWSVLPGSLGSPLGTVGQNYWWGMDVQYESQSGDALLVWTDGANIEYATWDGGNWSAVNTISYSGATPRQLQLSASPNSDEMVLVVSDSSSEDFALVWDGSSWGNEQILEQVAGDDRSDIYVTYEQQSGAAMVVYGKTSVDAYYRIWDGTSWGAEGSVSQAVGASGNLRWSTLASDPNSDQIALGVITSNGDTWLNVWDGGSWGTSELATTTSTGTNHPAVAVAFESTSGDLVAAYGESGSSNVKFKTWTAGGGWSTEQTGPNIGGTPNSLMLAADPISDQIMLSAQDSNSDVNYVLWDGTGWGTPTELGTSTTETKNQPFLFLWNQDGINQAPTAVADTFTVNEDTPTSLDLLANDTDPENDTLTLLGFERVVASYDAGTSGSALDPASVAGGSWFFEDTEDANAAAGNLQSSGVSPDGASGQNAWNLVDGSDAFGENLWYSTTLSPADEALADSNGWSLSAEIRLVDDYDDTRTTFIRYGDGSNRFLAYFDLDSNNDLTVELIDDGGNQLITLTNDGSGSADYHHYEIVYDPGTSTAMFLFDGVRVDGGGWSGEASTNEGVRWGMGSGGGQASANYHAIEMKVFDQSITTANGAPVTNNGDGTVNYAPTTNYTGADNFTYTMRDSEGHIQSANVDVYVVGVADGIRVTPLSLAPIGGETLVNTETTDSQFISSGVSQAMASDANGNYVVVWQSNLQDGSGTGIYAQLFNADGSAQGIEFQVNTTTTTDNQSTASVAMDDAGNFVVTWQSENQDGDSYGIYAQRFNAAGVAQDSEFQVNTYTTAYQGGPGIAMSASGDFVIQWASSAQDPDGSYGIYAQRFDAAGVAQGGEFRVNTYTNNYQQVSSISMDDAGNFVVTWGSLGQDGNNYGVFGQLFNADGSTRGNEFQVNNITANSQLYNDVVMLPDGRFVVTYQSTLPDTSVDLYVQAFNADGTQHGSEIKVNAASDMDYFPIPSITAAASGNFTVVWNNSNDGALAGVFMKSYDWDGNALTGEVQVNTTTAGNQFYPEIVAQPDGGLIVAWSGNGAGDVDGIFTQRYGLATDEDGGTASFQLVLESAPTADVVIPISVSDGTEGSVSVGSITFTSGNWNIAQTVTVTGLQDLIADGDQVFTVDIGPATSADPNFNGLDPENLTVTNIGTNTPPQITSDGAGASANVSVAENTTAVTTVTANDPDGDTPTFSITGGADQLLFDIDPNTGELTFKDAPNFELPADSNSDNVYVVTVTADDGKGGSDVQTISVTVTDANDAPVAVGDSIVAIEGVPYVAQLALDDLLLNDSDPDGDTLTVNTTPVSGPSNGALVLNADGTFTYTANNNFNGVDAFTYEVQDGNGGSAQATVTITVQPRDIRILFTTQSDVNNSKVPGVSSWDAGEVLAIGDPNLQFEPAGSDGSVLPYFDLEAFSASNDMTINGLHYVSNDITVGGANSIDLQRGDLLFVSGNNETMTSNNSLAINAGDVIVFRPNAVDDYSAGSFIHLLDQPGTAMTTGITLIEKDVTIGDVTLSAGGFLFTQQSIVEESSIFYHPADDVGAGTTSGTVSTLISSVDIDVNWNNFVGVMVINEDLYLDGTMVPAGSIVTTLAGGDSFVGANGITVNEDEIIYLTVTSTTMGSGTTEADATLLFDGGEIGLNNSAKKMNNLTIIEEIAPVNADPEITLAATALNYTEQNPPTVIDATASLVDADSANFDTGALRVELTVGGTVNDRLSINHQGTGAGQVGVSGSIVSYANVTIGSFSGGGSGSEPLVVVFNDNATVAAVQAVMRNVTYENQSPNPSTAQRTATFTVTDGDGGSSTAVARNINVSSINDAPVLTGANDLATINEDAFNNGGTLVSDLVSGWISDTDAGALEGIAVVAVDNSNGSWEFTTDNGSSWTAFGTVSTNDATLLGTDADTRVRFVPDPGWNGTVSNGITFHAWDQSIGANGDSVDLTLTANVSDQFTTVSYANDDGSGVWTSSWVETNDDSAAASGNVRIDSGKLRLDNLDGGTAESITRSADLSAAATATLTFDYDGYGAGGLDTIAFEVSNDGGTSWTLLENVDIVGNDSGSKSYTLEGFTTLTADMQVRISIVQGFDGAAEHINIDNVDIAYAGPGIGGSAAVSTATASSSISVSSVNNAPTMTMWYNEDWSTRKLLSIDAAQVAGDVTDFPVLITFNTDAELAAQALANGDDIIFTAGDGGTLLAHEIEYFDETTGELRAWVKTDLSASVNTEIYMYFGNATATNQEDAAGVWSSNYVGVYHLDESPTGAPGEIVDSSGSGNHAVTEGGMDAADSVDTAIGEGLAFDGANDMIRIPDSGSLDGLNDAATFSLWINWVDAADGDHQIIMASDNRYSGGDGYEWASQGDGDHFFYPDATSPDGNYNLGANPFTNNTWHHLAATMDFTTKEVKIYVDGNEMSFSYEGVPSRWTDLSASGDLLFGGNPDRATRFFEGMMDEIRLADVVRSQEWILTEANNQANPGTFLSVSSSETVLTRDTLTDINEDDFNSPGDSVQSIISSSGSDRIMDDDTGAVEGIAVIAVDDTNGQWQYDANADGSWVAFGSVSDTSAVLLETDALIRFVPNADYNGPAGDLTFRAWDQTSGVNGNTGIDVSANGGSSAYSSETFGATLNVLPVSDVPVITGDSSGSVQEDVAVAANNIATSGTLNIVDPDTGESTFQAATVNGTYGDLTIDTAGNWTYTADNTQAAIQQLDVSESITDTLTVTSFDGTTHDVVITINGSEDASVIGGTTTGSVTEDGTLTSSGLLTISDTDSSDPTDFADLAPQAGDNGHGTFEITSNTWTYTLDNNDTAVQGLDAGETLTDTYTFTAPDGLTQLVTVTINGAEDVPVFDSTAVTAATEDVAYSYTITTSDVDVESVSITAPTLPAWLTFVDNGDGTATLSGTPDNAEVGSHNVVLNVSDGTLSSNQNFTIVVSNTNDPAVIGGVDTGLVTEDSGVVAGFIEASGSLTIADPDVGESSFIAATINGSYGDLTIDGAGNWSYSADNSQLSIQALDSGETLVETLTVTSFDGTTHNVVITINGSEDAVVISGTTTGTVAEDGSLSVSDTLTITDTDASDNPISFTDTAPTLGDNGYGNFEITGNTWTYTLNNGHASVQGLDVGETLTDTFTFSASDGSPSLVIVTIDGAEDLPVLGGVTIGTVSEDGTLVTGNTLTITDADSSDNPVSFTDVAPTAGTNGYGSFEISGNVWSYTLNNGHAAVQALDTGETLSDSFTFTASDGSTQLVNVTINGAEDAPTVDNAIADQSATEDLAFNFNFAANSFGDLDSSDTLTYSATLSDDSPLPAWLSFDGVTRTFSGTPANADVGAIDIKVTADDGSSTISDTFTLTVINASDPPVIGGVDTGVVTEDVGVLGGVISTTGSLTIADPDAGESSFQSATINGTYGDLTIDSAGNWMYSADNSQAALQSLDAGESITDTLTVTTFDGSAHDITITLNGAEDAAIIGGTASGNVAEDGALTVSDTLTITDADTSDNPVSFNYVAPTPGANGYGDFEITGNTWTFTLNNAHASVQGLDVGESLSDSYTFTASDGSTAAVTVTINGAEDAPVLGGVATGTVTEDGALTASDSLTITDADVSDNPVSYNDLAPTTGVNGYGTFEITGNTWTFTLNNAHASVQGLDAGESLSDSFTFTASDGSTRLVNVTINGAEDAPTLDNAIADQTATEGAAFNFSFAANTFGDLDASDTLTYTATLSDSSPLPAWLSFDGATRSFSGTPGAGDVGTIDIRIIADDASGTVTDTFTLTVDAVNNLPVISGADRGALTEDLNVVDGQIAASGALTIADPDVGESSFVADTVKGALGSLTIDAAGNWRYSADNSNPEIQALQSGQTISEALTVTTADGSTHEIIVTINGTQEAAPPPVVEPPVVEPPPEEEIPPPEEVKVEAGSGEDKVLEEITRLPQGSTPPVPERTESDVVKADEPAGEVVNFGPVADKQLPRVAPQPQVLQAQNLNVDSLSLQVSDDEALNEQYELELLNRIDSMHLGMDSDGARQSADDVNVQIVVGSTASLTVGIVSWVLRGGALLASFMSTVPLLNKFDPLPILKAREDEEDVEPDEDTDIETSKHARKVDNMFSGKGGRQS